MPLDYLSRSEWDARSPSKPPRHLNSTGLRGTVLHWPGMGNRRLRSISEVASALRGWQNYHMDPEPDGRGWSDIAYQIAVDQAGRPWTLRGLTTQSGANGNETLNQQYGAILLVLGTGESPTTEMVDTTRKVITDFRRLYPAATLIKPHSSVRPDGTDCPGAAVRYRIATGVFEPRTVTPPKESEVTPAQMAELKEEIQRWAIWGALYEIETEDDRMAAADAYARAKAAGATELDAMKAASAHLSTLRAALKKAQAEL